MENDKGIYIGKNILLLISLSLNFFLMTMIYLSHDEKNLNNSDWFYFSILDKDKNISNVEVMSRGIRNNNPLNIRYSASNKWLGEVKKKHDYDFEEFISVEYGFRAAYKTLMTYRNKYNIKTIEKIIFRFSPPNENDTENIIKKISIMSGIPRDKIIENDEYPIIIKNMAIIESGNSFPIKIIKKGISIK
ncbi:structural protein P5 [Vibrio sp. Of14-4]|uniref:structural protein P5 n=1 Tax=Vibrio sp. Of14-4 TaxID=2724878 RepID=UPI001EF3B41F|nr:structural protein P5 [Vibrio sp. Of14-4]MCG7488584.1 structural protein P5 [Vibrio sp. Of14-4]